MAQNTPILKKKSKMNLIQNYLNNILNLEKKIVDFILKNIFGFFIATVSIGALLIRLPFISFISQDFEEYLHIWFEQLRVQGGLPGLKNYTGDYNYPYITILALLSYFPIKSLYAVKLVSILFDFIGAASAGLIITRILKDNPKKLFWAGITYSVILFSPSVLLNSSMWGQSDIIYTTFVLWSVLFLIEKKYTKSFILLGVAFAFKLQFIFILPLFVFLYFRTRHFSVFNFALIPITNFILCIPAKLFGVGFGQIVKIYFHQANSLNFYHDMDKSLSMGFPNMHTFVITELEYIIPFSMFLTLFFLLLMLYIITVNKITINTERIITLGIWSVVIVTYTLPGMHERYMFVVDVLIIIYFILYRKHLLFAITLLLITFNSHIRYLFKTDLIPMKLIAIIYLVQIFIFTYSFLKEFIKEDSAESELDESKIENI